VIEEQEFSDPLSIGRLMAGFPHLWGICGGWAIDLFLGRVTRPHKDVEIAVLRRDQLALQSCLAQRGWTMQKAADSKLIPWPEGEKIELPVHSIWCKNPQHKPDFLEVLLNEATETHFIFRRKQSVTLELERAFRQTHEGLRILAPEIVLLYEAKQTSRQEYAADFRNTLPHLDPAQRPWLKDALSKAHPGHEWLQEIL
jgi:hypothetical protein